jgi:phosphoglycerol transferase MdoB-like AlkP superfamily enzyme
MTGQFYENKIPMQDFIKEVYLGDSLPKILKENGYFVDLFAIKNTVYYDEQVASNFSKRKSIFIDSKEFVRFLTADFFKISPHFLKKFVYEHLERQAEKTATDQFFDFIDGIQNKSAAVALKGYKGFFNFYHLIGIHPPLTIDENLEIQEMDITRANLKKQGLAVLKAMEMFLDKLKELDVYNNSMIIIIADHGLGTDINLDLYKSGIEDLNKIPMNEKGTALPLVLVKSFDSVGKLKISDGPVALIDVPITIFKALGISGNFVGKSILETSENDKRTRRFLYFDWEHEYWKLEKRYLSPMKEYFVTGFSWLDSSWKDPGNVINPITITK